jgi:hypothetical protein
MSFLVMISQPINGVGSPAEEQDLEKTADLDSSRPTGGLF